MRSMRSSSGSRRPTGHLRRVESRESGMTGREENMKKPAASQDQSASDLISERIAELGDWRGDTLSRMRKFVKAAIPDVVEEWKWVKPTRPGTPVWSHGGIICTG